MALNELFRIVEESEDFRDTFFSNFNTNLQKTPYARAKYEKRYILRKMRYYRGDHKRKLYNYVDFLDKVIKATRIQKEMD